MPDFQPDPAYLVEGNMKKTTLAFLFVLILSSTSCRLIPAMPEPSTATPEPITAGLNEEFSLAPGQMASITGTDWVVILSGIPGDQRCPLNIECAMSGPVTIPVTVRSGSGAPQEFILQTFTDNDGSVPGGDFEGMTVGVEFEGYALHVRRVLPFPQNSTSEIRSSDYRVSLIVTK